MASENNRRWIDPRIALRLARGFARWMPATMEARLDSPVFLIGVGRSGSSHLAAVLRRHREVAALPYEANELWHPAAYPWGRSTLAVEPMWKAPKKFTEASLQAQTASDVQHLRALFGAFHWILGGKVFVAKSVMIHFMLEHVLQWFPNARFVHLVRDGRAVARSYARKAVRDEEQPNLQRKAAVHLSESERVVAFAAYWQRSLEAVERQSADLALGPDRLLSLTYEQLCSQPRVELQRLTEFLGVGSRGLAPEVAQGFESTNWKWQKGLAPDVQRSLNEQLSSTLTARGYAIDSPPPA